MYTSHRTDSLLSHPCCLNCPEAERQERAKSPKTTNKATQWPKERRGEEKEREREREREREKGGYVTKRRVYIAAEKH